MYQMPGTVKYDGWSKEAFGAMVNRALRINQSKRIESGDYR